MIRIFNELMNGLFTGNPQFKRFELVSFKYNDENGVHEVVLNEELHRASTPEQTCTCGDKCECDNKNVNVDKEICNCGVCDECVAQIEKEINEVSEAFNGEAHMHANDVPMLFTDLQEGDYVYAISDSAHFYGIFREQIKDTFYFHITVSPDVDDKDACEHIAFVDCCFNPEKWDFYKVSDIEKKYIDAVLANEEWKYDAEKKRIYVLD